MFRAAKIEERDSTIFRETKRGRWGIRRGQLDRNHYCNPVGVARVTKRDKKF